MQIIYSITGAKRKELVIAISQEINAPAKYLGMPSVAYEVGGYIIDKNGMVRGKDNPGLVADLQGLHDFLAVSVEYDTPTTYEDTGGLDFADLQMDVREELGLGLTRHEDCQGENGMQTSYVPDIDQHNPGQYAKHNVLMSAEMIAQIEDYYVNNPPYEEELNILTIEILLSGFMPEKLDNLTKLVNAKSSLIKAALGTDELPIQHNANTLRFPWFKGNCNSDEVKAYTHFVAALCEMAKKRNRVTASEKHEESEKYAFRCFLLRLGFIGPEYKADRKILLSKLTGSSAHKSGVKTRL